MQVEMLNGFIAIEQLGKSKKTEDNMFVIPEITDNLGIVKFLPVSEGKNGLNVGDKVYYGNERQQIRMAGVDVQVMRLENILARVEERGDGENVKETKS